MRENRKSVIDPNMLAELLTLEKTLLLLKELQENHHLESGISHSQRRQMGHQNIILSIQQRPLSGKTIVVSPKLTQCPINQPRQHHLAHSTQVFQFVNMDRSCLLFSKSMKNITIFIKTQSLNVMFGNRLTEYLFFGSSVLLSFYSLGILSHMLQVMTSLGF